VSSADEWRVEVAADAEEVVRLAAHELAAGLSSMLGARVQAAAVSGMAGAVMRLKRGQFDTIPASAAGITGGQDNFILLREPVRAGETAAEDMGACAAILLAGGTERAVLHAANELLHQLGARFPLGRAPYFPRIDGALLDVVEPRHIVPAFARRAMVSDLMTWHYETPERLAMHLESDRHFIRWMTARGLNAYSFIVHTIDSRIKIDELVTICRERGIGCEYGGHVLQLLLPRSHFDAHPEFFPEDASGKRNSRGNLCVSNPEALRLISRGAVSYVEQHPECEMLHIWGADVRNGAWCQCSACSSMSPQVQYLKVINTVAEALAAQDKNTPIAYLAYHDTIEPDPSLQPRANVHFEWAPRKRCYSHSIDDPQCEVNPRYFDALERYVKLFAGRGHIFEYYADAILFGGIAAATPSVIARDLRAYRNLGIPGVSCLTFGVHSAIAYPINLETFARGSRNPDFEPEPVLADITRELHPACDMRMADAYRAIARASSLILDGGGDVMRPALPGGRQALLWQTRLGRLQAAVNEITTGIEAADVIVAATGGQLSPFERIVWEYSREVVSGIRNYLAAAETDGRERHRAIEAALTRIAYAIEQLRAAAPDAGDTWAAYDLGWTREIWLQTLRRRFDKFDRSI
jgi:hypothetical protein